MDEKNIGTKKRAGRRDDEYRLHRVEEPVRHPLIPT
jgi:hypothetical protein